MKEGGNADELRRGEVGHDPVKEGARLVQFLTMAQKVGGGLARRSGVRWAATRSAGVGKERGREPSGPANLLGWFGEMGQMANGPVKGKKK
jgi:hypothetical protein